MTKSEILESMAKGKMVEKLIEGVSHQALDFDLSDLSQMIYEALLSQPEERIVNLYNSNALEFFIIGIIKKQLFSNTSPYFGQIRKFRLLTTRLGQHYQFEPDTTGEMNKNETFAFFEMEEYISDTGCRLI